MKHIGLIVLLLATALLTACEEKPYKPPVPHTEPDKSATKLFEPQREALDKAKGVGKTVEQASQEQKEAGEKAPGY
jgi:outer membrane biogenesis lipoprotein LolB